MKTIKLIILAIAAIVVSSNVWGTETEYYTYTFTQKQFEDNTTDKTLGTITWTPATAWTNGDGYWGYDGTKGQQWGSKSNELNYVTITTGSSITNVSKVIVSASIASSGSCDLSIKIGTTSLVLENTSNTSVSLTTSNTSYTFVNASPITGAVAITLTNDSTYKAQYIKDITIYTNTPTCTVDLDQPNVTATPGNNQTTLTWQEVTNATGYKVSWNGGADENPTDTRTFTKTGLTNGTQYTWKVKAIGDATYCDSETSGNVTPVAPPATATVTWMVDGTTHHTSSNVTIGSTISTPTNPSAPQTCGDAIFKGWTANQDYFHETAAPDDLFNGTSPAITSNITFYAIFADRQ